MKIHHLLRPPPVALLLNSTLPHILRVAAVAILNCWMASMCSNVRHARECMIARFHPPPSPKRDLVGWWEKKKWREKNGDEKWKNCYVALPPVSQNPSKRPTLIWRSLRNAPRTPNCPTFWCTPPTSEHKKTVKTSYGIGKKKNTKPVPWLDFHSLYQGLWS